MENQIDKNLFIQAFDSDNFLKGDDSCGDSNKYKIGYLLKKLGKKPITLDYRIFLEGRFKDNGYVKFRVQWIKKNPNGDVVENSPIVLPEIQDDDIHQ